MKKILWLLIVICCLSVPVKAKVYYGPYSEYSEYSMTETLENELTIVESERRYKVYKENRETVFLQEHEALPSYQKLDDGTIEAGPWLLTHNTSQYQSCSLYSYMPLRKVKYLQIANFGRANIIIEDLFVSSAVSIDKVIDMNDVNININAGEILLLDLKSYYDLEYLVINANLKATEKVKTTVTDIIFNFTIEGNHNVIKYASYTYGGVFTSDKTYSLSIDTFMINNPKYDFIEKAYCDYNKKYAFLISTESLYRDYIVRYKYEFVTKEYLDDYYKIAPEGYLIDNNEERTFYRYKRREKVEISDSLVINKKNFNIFDFVISSSVENIKITSDLNMKINGLYNINFILPFKVIETSVKVEISDNYLEMIAYQNSILKKYMLQNIDLNYSLNLKNIELKDVLYISDDNINKVKNDLLKCQMEYKILTDKKINLKQSVTEPDNKNSILFLLIGVAVGYLLNFLIIKKG